MNSVLKFLLIVFIICLLVGATYLIMRKAGVDFFCGGKPHMGDEGFCGCGAATGGSTGIPVK